VGLTPWGPIGGGFLSGKYTREKRPESEDEGRLAVMADDTEEAWHRRSTEKNWLILEVMDDIRDAHEGSTHAQIAIAWLLAQTGVDSVIIGVRTMAQLEDNLQATGLQLTADELKRLSEVSFPFEGYPYRFIRNYGTR
jgi:aryl-alcohol dehydrogenase-like predicted oxidoreductase